jgi:hypothetical protein
MIVNKMSQPSYGDDLREKNPQTTDLKFLAGIVAD